MEFLQELYTYRTMLASLVKRDLKGRYKGSALGFLWTFINPLLQLIVYSLVFKVILKNPMENYSMHLFVALVPWIFFSSALTTGTKAILGQANLVKKIYFPREIIPIAYATSSFINMLFSFVVIFAVFFVSPMQLYAKPVMMLPIVMLFQYLLVIGMNMITSALTVYFRDLEHIMGVLSMAWMYLSPVVYPISYIAQEYQNVYLLNPMAPILIAYRDILYYGSCPDRKIIGLIIVESLMVLGIGIFVFFKLKRYFAEEL